MSHCTILLNGTHLRIAPHEAAILQPLIAELESWQGSAYSPDLPACMPPPPAHVLTPSKLKALIGKRLESLPRARAIELELRILAALTVNGKRVVAEWKARGAQ